MNQFAGGKAGCKLDLGDIKSPAILLHGHSPYLNNKSLPVSLQDFILMNDNNIDKILAYNIEGQESFLQKKSNFTPIDKNRIKLLKQVYIKNLVENAPTDDKEKINKLIKYCRENNNALCVKQEIAERINKLQYRENSNKIIHDFWYKNADELNIYYYSDFK